jgi:c-di-GMP-related signal transduction protein
VFERFIARQAIFKDNLTLLGYELRFRANDSRAGASNGFSAAYLIDASTMVIHWESLTANALAFASLGEPELLSGVGLVLPRSKAVSEIAESVPCSAEVILACQTLKTVGYRLAELIRTALTRAYFCEELARPLGLTKNSSALFLMACCPPRMRCWTVL